MRKILFIIIALTAYFSLSAQVPTWSENVAQIIYDNCSRCHREGQIGPFELMSYTDAVDEASEIAEVVESGEMPPWPANPDYRHFAYEDILSIEEIESIVEWVENGMPLGNPDNEPVPPVFPEVESQLQSIDFTVEMEPYTLQYNYDEWRWFAIENPFDDTIYVNAIEVIPGLPELVHHADISYDLSGTTAWYDSQDPLPGFNDDTGYPNYDYYMNAWMAGGNVARYPEDWGIEVLPNSYFVFEIHYGPNGQGQTDSTKMRFEFVSDPNNFRAVQPVWLTNGPDEGSLYIPANEISWFTQESNVIWSEKSMISICPHQHMLGDTYKVWLETMEGDSIPLIDIPNWDFHWQMYYTFIYPQFIPMGSRIKASASYDNTVGNEENPNDPPEDVWGGQQTTDEMMMVYAIWANYEEGDENMLMDSTYTPTIQNEILIENALSLYPNPASDHIYFSPAGVDFTGAKIEISNLLGEVVLAGTFDGGVHRMDISQLQTGAYSISVYDQSQRWTRTFMKKN